MRGIKAKHIQTQVLQDAWGKIPENNGFDIDQVQTALDAIGLIPVVGEVADGVNAAISAGRGDYVAAGLSLVSMVPLAGDAVGKGGKIFRSMKKAADGMPLVEQSARGLGARVPGDILATSGRVTLGAGGVSVSPNSAMNLPSHRRPSEFGGTGKDPIWCMRTCDLPSNLTYRADPMNPGKHGFIEPAAGMSVEAYQSSVASTRSLWVQVQP